MSAAPKESTAKSLADWLLDATLLDPPKILVPFLVHEARVTLFSGREKVGKSTLVGGLVALASRGDPVLGEPIAAPFVTLWYTLDEPLKDTALRFNELGADPRRILLNQEPRTISELCLALATDLERHAAVRLVVVDTLSKVFALSGIDVNDSGKVEPALAHLVDVLRKHDVAAILLYHTGKAGREYRGSTAIGATVDEILTLRRRGESEEDDFDDAEAADDGRRLLVQNGRNLRGRVQLARLEGRYTLYNDAHPPRERILAALREEGSFASRTALAKAAHVQKAVALKMIEALLAERTIVQEGGALRFPTPTRNATPEPLPAVERFHGSPKFPEGGTAPEPATGTATPAEDAPGSRSRRVGGREPEPLPARPRQTIIRDGLEVVQERRETAHGYRWQDVTAA